MPFSSPKRACKESARSTVGPALAALLPRDPKPWYRTGHLLRLNLLLLVPLLSSTTLGYDGSMMNGLQTLPQWREFFNHPEGALLGLMNAVYPLGKLVGVVLVTYVSERWGRKVPLLIGLVTCIGFAIMQALAHNLAVFVTARAFLGCGTMFISQPSPILIAEVAYPTHRGKITALYNTFYGAIPTLQLAGLYFVPESPRWLISKNRQDDARRILATYHANGDAKSPLVDYEILEIGQALDLEARELSSASWFGMLRSAANRKRTLIAVLVGWFSQWTGVTLLSYYLTLVLNNIGITEAKDQTLLNGILQIYNWLTSIFFGAMMVDRFGRRPLFLVSTTGMLASFIAWTGLTSFYAENHSEGVSRAVVVFIFVFMLFYNIAWVPLLQAYTVEIFPFTLRGRGLSVAYFTACAGLLVGTQVHPVALKAIAWRYYIVFCCILGTLYFVVWYLFPETKGRTLEEIREVFEGSSSDDDCNSLENQRHGEKARSKI
ncbi:High-affinity glucose transporter [Paramyrothecium foliicola]|nr:High-affinity glucose transporter [Paramyrothecium foliicola]